MIMAEAKGIWYGAPVDDRCDSCGGDILEGEQIRVDGAGGFECRDCGQHDDASEPVRVHPLGHLTGSTEPKHWTRPTVANAGKSCTCSPYDSGHLSDCPLLSVASATVEPMAEMSAADQFLSAELPAVRETISGQPEADRDQYGRYLLKDPRTGKYNYGYRGKPEGFTRATTFNKTLSDTFALSEWGKRLTIVGLTRRPDLLALAHGTDVRADKTALNKLAEQACEAAGDKVAANLGTALHTMTEMVDAGTLKAGEAPAPQRAEVMAYAAAVEAAGLTFRQDLIERTTMTSLVGEDVAGTFDRMAQLPDGSWVIVDLKTGRDPLTYGAGEIAIQLLIYALGVNEFGVYDHSTKTWGPAPVVRTDVAIVIHLPVQRESGVGAFCELSWVDIGDPMVMEAAQQSAFARAWRKRAKSRAKAQVLHKPYVRPTVTRNWDLDFAAVRTPAGANSLWAEAKAAGVEGLELQRLVGIARDQLRKLTS
jgi:hypothetical protein